MWDFFTTVRNRHSVRKYQGDMPVEEEKLHAILEAASAAPSAGDLQAYHLTVVKNADLRKKISEIAEKQSFIATAPVALVISTDTQRSQQQFGERGRDLYSIQDATIAAAYAQLATCAAGLSSTWVGHFDGEKLKKILSFSENYEPVAILSIGYPAEMPEPTPRRPLSEICDVLE
ncbi:MAG: nitroreductase family protein [Gammaproteobacteria bacterium]|nr:nitroreductase family protein [Gammaproteobacteria bacterium]MDH5691655.1 nitroreductase family protein [Gammaproteobacteria bacterium]